ncbi:hypothetical protein HY484_02340 [Candidatus Woesearchaeota archaeon]|nr:hypothetical protein [Candidatus Woesearchaeota archaeon]
MPIAPVKLFEVDKKFINSSIATITAVIPRLATRYTRRKSDFLSHDDVILAEEAIIAVEGLLRQLMRFGVFVPFEKSNGSWGSALESAVKLNEVWQKVHTHSVVDVGVFEEILVLTRKIRAVLEARIASGKWV